MAKVFLSHSSKDKPFVRELYRRLTRDGVTCFFDEESIEWGDNFVTALEDAIDESERIILVLSPDFVDSEWVRLERTSAMADDPGGLKRKLLPLRLHNCKLPIFLKPIQSIDVSSDAEFDRNYPRICKTLGGTLRHEAGPPRDRLKLPPLIPHLPARHRMPYRSLGDAFIGRVDSLWTVYDQLTQGRTSVVQGVGVVCGTGGIGKTQLAVEYVHRFADQYPGGIFWVEADQGISRLVHIIALYAKLDVDGKLPEADQLEHIWIALNAQPANLIVLDNFPENLPLEGWLPPTGSIHVLVTTRRRDLNRHPHLSLEYLTTDEALALLNSGTRKFGEEAKLLADDVGRLTLALELLKSHLNRTSRSIEAVRLELARAGEIAGLRAFANHCKDELPTRHSRDVVSTFQASWDLASSDGRDALCVMSHLAPAVVPRRLLLRALGWSDEHRLDSSIADLWELSLIDLSPEGEPAVHRLLRAFVRVTVADDGSWRPTLDAVRAELQRSFDIADVAKLHDLERVLPHAEALLGEKLIPGEVALSLASALGSHHQDLGRFQRAKYFARKALELAEASLPQNRQNLATWQSNLALILQDLGELAEARDLLRVALAADLSNLPPSDPTIAIRRTNLARVLKELGNLEEARDLLRQALASDLGSYPAGHPEIAADLSNLAAVLSDLGEFTEARDLLRKALNSDMASYPANHPTVAFRQSSLALVLKELGEFVEARDLLRRALASNLETYSADHPQVARNQSSLALVLRHIGELPEARDLLRQALESDLKTFAPGHPSIATKQCNLALVLQDLGEYEEAQSLVQAAYDATLATFGPDHHKTKTFHHHRARIFHPL